MTPQTEFADFYRTRPATIPAGTDGSTKDITIHDNATAMVTTSDKHEQCISARWSTLATRGNCSAHRRSVRTASRFGGLLTRSLEVPGQTPTPRPVRRNAKADGKLEKLDPQAGNATPSQQARSPKRAEILQELAGSATDETRGPSGSGRWPTCSAGGTGSGRKLRKGLDQLDQLAKELAAKNAKDP